MYVYIYIYIYIYVYVSGRQMLVSYTYLAIIVPAEALTHNSARPSAGAVLMLNLDLFHGGETTMYISGSVIYFQWSRI